MTKTYTNGHCHCYQCQVVWNFSPRCWLFLYLDWREEGLSSHLCRPLHFELFHKCHKLLSKCHCSGTEVILCPWYRPVEDCNLAIWAYSTVTRSRSFVSSGSDLQAGSPPGAGSNLYAGSERAKLWGVQRHGTRYLAAWDCDVSFLGLFTCGFAKFVHFRFQQETILTRHWTGWRFLISSWRFFSWIRFRWPISWFSSSRMSISSLSMSSRSFFSSIGPRREFPYTAWKIGI